LILNRSLVWVVPGFSHMLTFKIRRAMYCSLVNVEFPLAELVSVPTSQYPCPSSSRTLPRNMRYTKTK
jgi:hypothetical protein